MCTYRDTCTGPNNYTPHISADVHTSHTHPGKHSHIFSHHPFPFSRPVLYVQGHALVVKIGLLFWGPLVHIQGHLHWSQQLHPHISADVHTSLTPREALTHFFTPPLPFQQACLVRTRARTGSKDRSAFLGATCAHTGTPALVPTTTPHTSVLMYTHHSHPGKHSPHFFTPPLPFQQACLVRTRARTGSKDRSAFLGATCAHTGTPALVPTTTPTHQC